MAAPLVRRPSGRPWSEAHNASFSPRPPAYDQAARMSGWNARPSSLVKNANRDRPASSSAFAVVARAHDPLAGQHSVNAS